MKLKDIILEQDWKQDNPEFKSKFTGIDPETGSYSWDIEYTSLINLRKDIEELYESFKETLKEYPADQKLEQFFEEYASFKRKFKTYVNRKYDK